MRLIWSRSFSHLLTVRETRWGFLLGYQLIILCLNTACSLVIDTTPEGLKSVNQSDYGGTFDMIDAGRTTAGGSEAGESDVGGSHDGGFDAGEIMSGDMINDGVHASISSTSNPISPPPNQLTRHEGNRYLDDFTLNSLLTPFLPNSDCLVYDQLAEACLVTLDRDDFAICSDWQQHYPLNQLTPWTGDRATCDQGTYDPLGLDDFVRALNLYRRQLRLPELEIEFGGDAQNCALAYDVLHRDQRENFSSDTPCYTDDIAASLNIPHNIAIGSWSLYTHLHKILALASFDTMSLSQKANFRHSLLIAQATKMMVGSRGYAMCFRPEIAGASNSPEVLTYPAPGINPYAIVNSANHEAGSVPWTIAIAGEVRDLTLSLNTIQSDGSRVAVALNEVAQETSPELNLVDMKLFGFTLAEEPQVEIAYELDIQWLNATEARHVKVTIGFKDCGLSQPVVCDVFPDTCVVTGTRCAPFPIQENSVRHCVFSGPLERGDLCDRLGTESCREGICISVNEGSAMCGEICDPSAPDHDPTSCDQRCPSGSSDYLGLQVCQ